MDREAYNACMKPHMTGKGRSKEERQQAMCLGAKLCTGKASTEEEAQKLCDMPRPVKPPKAGCPLRAVLLTSDNCTPCDIMREKLEKPLGKGEITEINISKNPEQGEQFIKDDKVKVPSVLVLSSDGVIIASAAD